VIQDHFYTLFVKSLAMSPRLRLPKWTRPFIEEQSKIDHDVVPKKSQGLPYVALLLLILAITGFVLQALIKIAPPSIPLAIAAVYLVIFRPRTASISLLVVYTGLLVLQVSQLASAWQPNTSKFNLGFAIQVINIAISFISIVSIVNLPLRDPSLSKDGICRPFAEPTIDLRSPEDDLTLWQWMSVSWMSSLISVGKARQLSEDDVWSLGYEFQHRHLHDAFRELEGTVVRRLLRANWIDLVILTVLAIIELAANYSAPLLLQQLLKAMETLSTEKKPAITFALLILGVTLVAAQSAVFSLWFGRRAYERSRGEMITMLYEKTLNRKIIATLKEDPEPKSGTNSGEDTTYVSPCEDGEDGETSRLLNGHDSKPDEKKSFLSKIFGRKKKKAPLNEENAPASMGKILNLMRGDVYEVSVLGTSPRSFRLINSLGEPEILGVPDSREQADRFVVIFRTDLQSAWLVLSAWRRCHCCCSDTQRYIR
jgi:hypothetical protein